MAGNDSSAGKSAAPPAAKPTDAQKKDDKKKKVVEMSEEDIAKKEALELYVTTVSDKDAGLAKAALNSIRSEIKSATSSMTSIPKPLKFMRAHFDTLKTVFETYPEGENKTLLADILSLLAMTMPESEGLSLKYKLAGTKESLELWGHEYVRNLTAEIAKEYARRTENADAPQSTDDLMALVDDIIPFHMRHHAETDACDLLLEVNALNRIVPLCDDRSYKRVTRYLQSIANYYGDEDVPILKVVVEISRRNRAWTDALLASIKCGDLEQTRAIFEECDSSLTRKQLAFILARQGIFFETEDEAISDILRNNKLSDYFLALAADLDVMEPKTADDIYKTHLDPQGPTYTNVDSARNNLATTFVNAFVNAGFRRDKLMTDDGTKWIYKNRDHAMMSAAASLGMVWLWDVEAGLTQLDKYMYMSDDNIKAGALMGMGILTANVRNESDPALALLSEELESGSSAIVKTGCIMGLGFAYAGSAREDVLVLLRPIIEDGETGMDTVCHAALALGLVFVGTGNPEVTQALISVLMERSEVAQYNSLSRFVCLALGLLYLGKGSDAVETTLMALAAVPEPLGKYASLTVDSCAAAFSCDVMSIQRMLQACSEATAATAKKEADKAAAEAEKANSGGLPVPADASGASTAGGEGDKEKEEGEKTDLFSTQSVAVLGISLAAMGEEIGQEMILRSFSHLLQFGDVATRRAVPVAIGLSYISNPNVTVTDTLSKLSHDNDGETAQAAIFALGLIGAGTNNARIAGLLRQLAVYYQREASHLFVTRLAQGLLHLGKGTISLQPAHAERFLFQPAALAGLLVVCHAAFDLKNTLLGRTHYLIYSVVTAMFPRMMMALDTNLKPLPIPIRVGQAVDTVGQAGQPKTITGFQTHTSPVLLSYGERAELGTTEYRPLSSVLEGLVIVEKKPEEPPKTAAAK